jgi:hypothetical protein
MENEKHHLILFGRKQGPHVVPSVTQEDNISHKSQLFFQFASR